MKRTITKLLYLQLFLGISVLNFTCKKEVVAPSGWISSYSNIVIGDQNNNTNGHFVKSQTGESIKVENAATQQKSLVMLFFTESGGANSFLTFPANAAGAASFGPPTHKLFTNNPGGLNFWDQANMNSGLIHDNVSMTSVEFDALLTNKDWTKFNDVFKSKNDGKESLAYKVNYTLNPISGDVYLVQFNGLVRAIICIRSVVTSGASGGSLRFDMILEGRENYLNSNEAKLIQALKK